LRSVRLNADIAKCPFCGSIERLYFEDAPVGLKRCKHFVDWSIRTPAGSKSYVVARFR